MCHIFQMITDFQIFIFFTKVNLHPSFISKKMLIFIAVTFRNTFSTFLLVLTVGKLFNNSNKYQLFNKSGNNFFFLHNRPNIGFLFQKMFDTLRCRSFHNHPLLTKFRQVWGVAEVCNISDVYHLSNMSAVYWYFYARNPISVCFFSKNVWCFPS